MATTALGIMQDSAGNGVDPHTHRKIIQARWSNPGVITGLSVTGGSGLTYIVSAGCAVVTRGESDGYAEAYFEGGSTPSVSAGDPSNPRVDLVWIKANDIQQGDDDNRVHVGVTSGTPSASPVAPSAPAGCLPIASMLVPAGATSTASAQMDSERDYAIPYGSSLGLLVEYHDTADAEETLSTKKTAMRYQQSVYLPTARLVELDLTVCAFSSGTGDDYSNLYTSFAVDGEYIANAGGEVKLDTQTAMTFQRTHVMEVEAGNHTFAAVFGYSQHKPHYRYGSYGANMSYPGRVFRIWDRGVA